MADNETIILRFAHGGSETHPYQIGAKKFAEMAGKDVVDTGFIKQLRFKAKSFRSGDAYPYKAGDAAWLKAGGPLKLCIGPYEVENDRQYETKTFFQYMLAMEDEEKTKKVRDLVSYKNALERKVAELIGSDLYTARDLTKNETPTPFVRVIKAAGEMHSSRPVPIAHNLPNLYRNEIGFLVETFSNHYEAKKSILEDIASIVIAPDQQQFVDYGSFIDNGHYHEFTHATGPQGDYLAKTSDGSKVTVSAAIGEGGSALEEGKADTGDALFSAMVYGAESQKFKQDAVTAIASLFRSSRFGVDSHGIGGMFRLAYFVEKGAIVREGGRFRTVFDKVEGVSGNLMREIGRIQASGNKAAAEKFIGTYMPKGEAILKEVVGKINAAGVPIDVDIHYEITL